MNQKQISCAALIAAAVMGSAACSPAAVESGGEAPRSAGSFLPGAVVVGSEPTCFECEVDLERIGDIAESRDRDVLKGDFRSVVRADNGVIVTTSEPGAPLHFGDDGRLIRMITGREDLPPAFSNASIMRKGAGDTTFVMDDSDGRIAVVGPFLNVVRFIPVPVTVSDMAPLRNGSILLASPQVAGDSLNPLVYVASAGGPVTPVPGTALVQPAGADPLWARRVLAPSRDGEYFWSAHTLRYAIEKRSLAGELIQTLERDAEWFPPAVAVAPIGPEHPPTPRVVGVWEDSRGYIWVHTLTADGRWPTAIGELHGVNGVTRYYVQSRDLFYDTRLEVIDPNTGGLVATAKFDAEIPTFTPGPLLSRVVTGANGWLIGELYRARLIGHP